MRDYYEVLQVHPAAEDEIVAAAYKRLALKYHPDVNSDPAAKERMQAINLAYEVLKDPVRRAAYDRQRQQASSNAQGAHPQDTDSEHAKSNDYPGESFIEKSFRETWQTRYPQIALQREYPVQGSKQYRIDFAHPETRIGVELDGHAWHNDPERFTSDRQRDREIQRLGWRLLHFSGREVTQPVDQCVTEVYNAVQHAQPAAATSVEREQAAAQGTPPYRQQETALPVNSSRTVAANPALPRSSMPLWALSMTANGALSALVGVLIFATLASSSFRGRSRPLGQLDLPDVPDLPVGQGYHSAA